jgi:hypothetical protein
MKARVALLASVFCLGLVAMATAQVSTVEGTVVSNSGGSLVIDTDSGQRTFMVDAQSSLPADLAVGSRVRVEYHTLANDKFHAFKVSSLGAATTTETAPAAPTEMAPAATTTEPAPATTTAAPETTTTTGTTTGTMQDRPATDTTSTKTTTDTTTAATDTQTTGTERTLPATASQLPLLALAGALSMAGGALLRRIR